MFKYISLLLLIISVNSWAKRDWVTDDFYIEKLTSMEAREYKKNKPKFLREDNKDCRTHIEKVMCLVNPAKHGEDSTKRKCLEGGKKYAHFFQDIHDRIPPFMQKMFCSLDIIFIEKSFGGTAYAGLIYDEEDKPIGARMGVRESVLRNGFNLTLWSSWKEQLSFGGNYNAYEYTLDLPNIITVTDHTSNDFLYFLVAHEFGHFFDFANKINDYEECNFLNQYVCGFKEGTWGDLTWLRTSEVKEEFDFKNRSGLCFYSCDNQFISFDVIESLYDDLYKSTFISTYAATNSWDDFAEGLSYYLMDKYLATSYYIQLKNGKKYDMMKKLKSPQYAEKYEYIKNFVSRDDILYP